MSPSQKHYGLKLTLGGAPNTPHRIPGFSALFEPDRPTPVGGDGEITLEAAQEADKARGVSLELVELSQKEVDEGRERQAELRVASKQGALAVRRDGRTKAEQEQVRDEIAALSGEEG